VVAGNIKERHVERAHEVFEVVERQVAAAKNEVGARAAQPVTVQSLIDLVGDGEYARGAP